MAQDRQTSLQTARGARDPFAMLKQMTAELDRVFDQPIGSGWWPPLRRTLTRQEPADWIPEIDVFERDNRLVTKVDLPGMKKEDVKVEVIDGHLTISGERRSEAEEKKENMYRCERSYGSFYRSVPLPDGVKLEDVKATFADGVLEVSLPVPVKAEAKPRTVPIEEPKSVAAV
jgi:HSP20 family protein